MPITRAYGSSGGGGGGAVSSVNGQAGTVVLDADDLADGSAKVQMTTGERTKLAGVADAATANATDTFLRDRANHTGTQTINTLATTGTAGASTYLRGDGAWSGLATIATSGSAADLTTGTAPTARLGSGTASATTFLRGDNTWATPSVGTAVGVPTVINVKDTPYSATGNGTTDDTAAIQAALDAVPAGGGIVWLPAGRYKVSSTLVIGTHATVMQGAVAGHPTSDYHNIAGTRLEASGTLSGGPMLRAQMAGNTEPLYGCVLRNLTLDGMSTATGAGLHWRSYQSHIEGVHVYRFGTYGFHFQGYGSWNLYDTIVDRVEAAFNTSAGIYMDVGAVDMHFTNMVIYQNGINFHYREGSSILVTNSHFYDASATDGIRINGGGSRSKFTNCKIEGAQQHCVNMDTTNGGPSEVQFVGCNFAGASRATANTYDLFIVQGPGGNGCWKPMLVGCTFDHYDGGALPRYQVNLGVAAQVALVVGCNFGETGDYGTAAVNDASASSLPAVIRSNGGPGYITRKTGTATVTSGNTSVTVTHGVTGITPTAAQVKVTPTNSMGSATKWWVTTVGATTFVINTNVDPGGTTATFAWEVDV